MVGCLVRFEFLLNVEIDNETKMAEYQATVRQLTCHGTSCQLFKFNCHVLTLVRYSFDQILSIDLILCSYPWYDILSFNQILSMVRFNQVDWYE
jgi:hypothetical protein